MVKAQHNGPVRQQTGLVTLRYTYRDVKNGRFAEDGYREQELSLIGTYRF